MNLKVQYIDFIVIVIIYGYLNFVIIFSPIIIMTRIVEKIIDKVRKMYPEMYNSVKALIDYNKQVSSEIDSVYGVNTLENIIKTNEYNREIDNIENGIVKDTYFWILANKRQGIFKIYLQEINKVAEMIGRDRTLTIVTVLEEHFK